MFSLEEFYQILLLYFKLLCFIQVNGAVINIRMKADKLAVWLADASQSESVLKIGKMLKERLGISSSIGFNVHNEEKSMIRSNNSKQRFQV